MKLTKKLEKEIQQLYHAYWDGYMKGDMDMFSVILDEDVKVIGSTENEVFYNKQEALSFYLPTADQIAGKAELRNRKITIEAAGNLVLVTELNDFYILIEDSWTFYAKGRLSTFLQNKDGSWKIIQQHGSMPDIRAIEGEQFALEKISKENLELRDAVKRRTTELEQKNRELEIETSLERVRSVAMGMNKADDMLDVCRVISEQVGLLHTGDIRNVQTAIFYPDKKIYRNYEYYRRHDKAMVTDVDYTTDKRSSTFAAKMQAGAGEFFTDGLSGKAVQEWYEFQKTTAQFPDPYLETATSLTYYWFSLGPVALGCSTYTPLTEEEINVFKRFRNVFELAYRRFLDIQQAALQAHEAKIEASLERIRAVAMSLRKREELITVCEAMYKELLDLSFSNIRNAQVAIKMDEKHAYLICAYSIYEQVTMKEAPYTSSPLVMDLYKRLEQSKDAFYQGEFSGEKFKEWRAWRESLNTMGDPRELSSDSMWFYLYSIGSGHIGISTFTKITDEQVEIVKRFKNVFELSYQRYNDVANAEAQAREAKIEAALERTRTQSMLMQHSNELDTTLRIIHQQLEWLDIPSHFTFLWLPEEELDEHVFWATWMNDENGSTAIQSKTLTYPLDRNERYTAECLIDWKSGIPIHTYFIPPADIENYFAAWKELLSGAEKLKPALFREGLDYVEAYMKYGCFGIVVRRLLTDDEKEILRRFAIEFERTYTRFLDLKKSEAQAREAEIELALERVRARTMAMQKSEELAEISFELFKQVQSLGVETWHCAFNIYDTDQHSSTEWGTNVGGIYPKYKTPRIGIFLKYYEIGKTGETLHIEVIGEDKSEAHYAWLCSLPGVGEELLKLKDTGISFPTSQIDHVAYFRYGYLLFISYKPVPEAHEIFKRFAIVFEQTYTRFLDLQKAEAQTRESRIEASLEKVRSRTLAMQKSDELSETAAEMFRQLIGLGIEPNRLYIGLVNDETGDMEMWATDEDGTHVGKKFMFNKNENASVLKLYDGWKAQRKSVIVDMQGEELENYFRYLNNIMGIPFKGGLSQKRRVQSVAYFSKGFIGMASPDGQGDEALQLLERFAAVFNLTYTRFNDLQIAEAQTHKAKIETALERVRARALAMQQPEELKEVAEVLRHEMGLLGVEELETCSIYIHDEQAEKAECWYALRDTKTVEKKLVNDYFALNLKDTWVGKQMLQFYNSTAKQVSIVMQGTNRKEWINYCEDKSIPLRGYYGEVIPDRTYHLYKFSHGAIGAAVAGEISNESWDLLQRAASVFSLAYSRFKDLTQARIDLLRLKEEKQRAEDALSELQVTQRQLIQSEKMASLGELTAGIAHEIQNPLNFVNNFSEVSTEMLDEMIAELAKNNPADAITIADDIKQNLEKILHHGKRADGIVKGMLQHSRSSSGLKEPTNINTLADEYLRLAYHGLRAKDKSFNAVLKTDYDESLGNVEVIPQDIGRVILNLIMNAFYAVGERKKQATDSFQPTVTVSTKKNLNNVEVKVSDNGIGIPQKVLDKIFQPFFTTKPTGQGTGLGLSLSYDIVKAHRGELKVETNEGEGTEFIIQLPTS